jgi:hypothetical protein
MIGQESKFLNNRQQSGRSYFKIKGVKEYEDEKYFLDSSRCVFVGQSREHSFGCYHGRLAQ